MWVAVALVHSTASPPDFHTAAHWGDQSKQIRLMCRAHLCRSQEEVLSTCLHRLLSLGKVRQRAEQRAEAQAGGKQRLSRQELWHACSERFCQRLETGQADLWSTPIFTLLFRTLILCLIFAFSHPCLPFCWSRHPKNSVSIRRFPLIYLLAKSSICFKCNGIAKIFLFK